ncbi:MAG: hypothetical protein WC856_26160 [Methylococcaceae bacterium]
MPKIQASIAAVLYQLNIDGFSCAIEESRLQTGYILDKTKMGYKYKYATN